MLEILFPEVKRLVREACHSFLFSEELERVDLYFYFSIHLHRVVLNHAAREDYVLFYLLSESED
jgi:hypothetical protein